MTKLLKIAGYTVATCATIALAQPATAAEGVTAAATAAATADSAASGETKPAGAKKYCINVIPDTGSRMARRMCKTKAEWADEGLYLDTKK